MLTAILTLAWRGIGFDKGAGFAELRLGLLGVGFCRGTLWSDMRRLRDECDQLKVENERLQQHLKEAEFPRVRVDVQHAGAPS